MAKSKKTLVLIDGHSNLHKAYHAIRDSLTNRKGEPTSAVYGFLNTFFRLNRHFQFEYIAVVFDAPGKTFRDDLFDQYKANRPSAPEDLKMQDRRVREALELLQVPVLEIPGFEADDVIACLAHQAVESGGEAIVCSSDKDLLQAVGPGIRVWREHLQKSEELDEAGVMEKLGVRPEQVPAYLGLVGDTSDNIPGVPGIGKKSAATLLQNFNTLDDLLSASADDLKATGVRGAASLAKKLAENAGAARLSQDLATLRSDCLDKFNWDEFLWIFKPSQELREFYREMNFQSFLNELGGETVEERPVDYGVTRTRADLEKAAKAIKKAGAAAIDTETDDLNPFEANLVGLSLSWEENQAVYIPVGHHEKQFDITLADVKELLGPLLRDPKIKLAAHHWGYDYKILKRAGFDPGIASGDTMIAAYLLNPDKGNGTLRLKDLALSVLGIQMTEIRELIGDGDDMVTMASVTVDDTAQYACQDADATLQLHRIFEKDIEDAGLADLYRDVELPLINVLADMELEGIRIDIDYFRQLSKDADEKLLKITGEIYEIAGEELNINSSKQVAALLFEKLQLPAGKKGKSGVYSTDVTVLEGLKNVHPLPAKLLEYRQIEKLKNTYIDPIPSMVSPRTGRLHSSFNQTIAATGRLSSSNPNLQNIPVRTEAGRLIRKGFIPREENWKLLAADYSQIELRILAHLSGDEALTEAFRSGEDIHTLTASKIFGVALDQVAPEQRSGAKAINFGIIYGMTEYRLARDLDIPRGKARQFIEDYFRVYSGVSEFIKATKEKARVDGYVTTLLGRRRFVPDLNARNFNQRSLAERIAVNTPIQGTSADMIKLAMIRVARRIEKEKLQSRMLLQVHDELIFDVPDEEVEKLGPIVKQEMAEALPLDVPIQIDMEVGESWDLI